MIAPRRRHATKGRLSRSARRVGDVSVMPAKLVESLSPADFADLISYLLSLKQAATAGQPTAR